MQGKLAEAVSHYKHAVRIRPEGDDGFLTSLELKRNESMASSIPWAC